MGSNRSLILLGLALVVLGGLYFMNSGRRAHIDETGGFEELVEGQLSTDEVFGIAVSLGGDAEQGFDLAKQGDDWIVTNHFDAPANLNKIRTLLGNLEGLTGEYRSDDAEVLDDYALDEENAYHVTVRNESGDALAQLLVGKRGGTGGFVRKVGSNTVYLADHNFLSDFGVWGDERKAPDVKSWVDLVAFKVERDAVQTLELRGDNTVVMSKEFPEPAVAEGDSAATPPPPDPNAYEWRVTEPSNFLATKTRADAVLNSLTSLRARDVAGRGEGEWGFDEAKRIVVTTEDGTQHTLLFGAEVPEEESQLYFQVEGEDLVWSIPDYLTGNLFKSADDLKSE